MRASPMRTTVNERLGGSVGPGQAGARLWPELEDDVDRGLGDLPEPAEARVVG
jgi:hypothetical protein